MGDVFLQQVSIAQYLGVTIDEKLTRHQHLQELCNRLLRSVGIISKLRHYVDIPTLISIYYTLVNSHLQYGILCWESISL